MARFNKQKTSRKKTTNLAGGAAYSQSSELEFASILLTSFVTDSYYRSADDTVARVIELIKVTDKKFVAQAAIYARNVFGMRSITHVVAAEIAKHISGEPWAKNFYASVIFRPDDMMETASYYLSQCAKPAKNKRGKKDLTSAMKAGFAMAFNKFDKYALAKYRGENKDVKLIDVMNLCHPAATDKNREALNALVTNSLKSFDTWETELTKAGQVAETEEQKGTMKKEAWGKLVREKKLGYLAMLRNLRNIMEQAPGVLPEVLEGLTNEAWIKKSLIFPFQYLIAYKQFSGMNTKEARSIAEALSTAVDLSCQNVQTLGFEGNTLVAVDNSGSMESAVANSEHMRRSELGALFGVVLAKAINADIMEFGDNARYVKYGLKTHSMDFAADFHNKNQVGHGTNFHSVIQLADKKYDRIIFFSDMQGWAGGRYTADEDLKVYNKKFGAQPFIYSFDLAGYGSMQFPESKTFCIAGFSEKIFTIMAQLEKDKQAMINEIKKITL